jgi:hypothetical protein
MLKQNMGISSLTTVTQRVSLQMKTMLLLLPMLLLK